jgi:Ca2+-binding RTX toxin-like protein
MSGTAAANVLTGTAAADVICGLGGNDVIKGQGGNDTIIGGAGIDSVDFANAAVPVTANLSTGAATGQGTDKLLEVESIDGSPYADKLTGDTGPNRLSGKSGKDTLSGLGGPDQMYGGDSDDQIVYFGAHGQPDDREGAHRRRLVLRPRTRFLHRDRERDR